MFNNLILVASCFSVLWGTLFPVISEAVTGEKISVDAPFFNKVNVPIGLFLLFLTGVGPLIAWRRSSIESLKKAFLGRWSDSVVLTGALLRRRDPSLLRADVIRLVPFRDLDDLWPSSTKAHGRSGRRPARILLLAAVELTHRNTRRYGGYLDPHGHRDHVHRIHGQSIR